MSLSAAQRWNPDSLGKSRPQTYARRSMAERAAIYVRISQDRTGLAAGVSRQQKDCLDLVKRRGWTAVEIYPENDRSAWNGNDRPEWQRLLADADAGRFDVLVAWHDDRLWRSVTEQQLVFTMLHERGVGLIVAGGRDYHTGSVDDSVLSGFQALMAQKESADKSRRIRRKAEELANEGKLNGRGGKRPFGYEKDFVTIREAEAALIRNAVDRVLIGEPLGRITREWNERGIKAVEGGVWHAATLRRILTSGRICGWREHHGEPVAPAVWPEIIDRETWDRLQAKLRDPARAVGKQARFLLSGGLAVCGICGWPLAGRRRDHASKSANGSEENVRVYACTKKPGRTACGGIFRIAEPLEELVREAVFAALDGPALTRAIRAEAKKGNREAELLRAIRKDEEALEQLARDHYVDGRIGRAEFLAVRPSLEARLEKSKGQLAGLDRDTLLVDVASGGEAVRAAWDERGLEWRRALFRTVLERVVVHKAVVGRNFFDPEKIELVWRS